MISVIIPVLNEEKLIGKTLENLRRMEGEFEVLVIDGGSTDKTVAIAKKYAPVIASKKGRAVQMNTGAGRARGSILFFLHADALPDKESFLEIEEIMRDPRVVGGALHYALDEKSLLYRNHVFWSNLRARLTGIYPGDHGIFVGRAFFDRAGGYPAIPIMEDVALCKRLKKSGRLVQASSRITSSSRRFKQHGFARTVLQMWTLRLLYFLGASPEGLAKRYGDAR